VSAHTVGILGGMGPAAGADFVRLFVAACAEVLRARGLPVVDQAFPMHWLVQAPVPDRTAALQDPNAAQPLAPMIHALGALRSQGVGTVAIACNTAHAWHPQLRAAHPGLRILHAMEEVAETLQAAGTPVVGLLATEGTYRTGVYQEALSRRGILCAVPDSAGRDLLMDGIYQGVKAGNLPKATMLFERVARALVAKHRLSTVILGCTEIPLALSPQALPGVTLLDAANLLARRLAACAYGSPGPA